jgi:hypothetical protein
MIQLKEILVREITKMDDLSKKRQLDLDEIRALDLLVKSWRSLCKDEDTGDTDPLFGMTVDQLLSLAKSDSED